MRKKGPIQPRGSVRAKSPVQKKRSPISSKKFTSKNAPTKTSSTKIASKRPRRSDSEAPETTAKAPAIMKGFSDVWGGLFTSPIHLDSALSKLTPKVKTVLAQIIPSLLLRPASQAEALGIGMAPGEPWSLNSTQLSKWRAAELMVERLYTMMTQGLPSVDPMKEDFPEAMIKEWEESWGKEALFELIDILGREAPLGLRTSRKFGAQAVLKNLTEEVRLPVKAELSKLAPLGIRLSGYAPVLGTDLYEKGAFEIQDEGSQLMALFALWPERYAAILQDRPGKIKNLDLPAPPLPKDIDPLEVVDACAGAGGKTLALADALKGKGRVYAYDVSEKKLQALRRRATHAGLNNIQAVPLVEGKESEMIQKFNGKANIVLVDAPCSGWGVLRRNPDIKWRQSQEVLKRMPEIQERLLSIYSKLVAPGGRLVFGVCTFRIEETREVVEKFLKKHPDFVAKEGGYLGPGPSDGFFMQAFERKS